MQESGFDFHHIRLVNEMFRDTGRAKLISVLQYLDESFFDLGVIDSFLVFWKIICSIFELHKIISVSVFMIYASSHS